AASAADASAGDAAQQAFDPSGWWNLLQSQFNQLASLAMAQPGMQPAAQGDAQPDTAAPPEHAAPPTQAAKPAPAAAAARKPAAKRAKPAGAAGSAAARAAAASSPETRPPKRST
ncbi:TPA: PhaM family polyhydroxyalkanoate granule multifunctional regulatory protein, partial [Burkholderia lata]